MMEKGHPPLPEKSGSFSGRDEKNNNKPFHHPIRNLSVNYIMSHMPFGGSGGDDRHLSIVEEEPGRDDEDGNEDEEGDDNHKSTKNYHHHHHHHHHFSHHHKDDNSDTKPFHQADAHHRYDIEDISDEEFAKISDEVDVFLQRGGSGDSVPLLAIEKFITLVGKEVLTRAKEEEINGVGASPLTFRCKGQGQGQGGEFSLLEAIDKVVKVSTVLEGLPSEQQRRNEMVNRTNNVIHDAMMFLEEELRTLLEDPNPKIEDQGEGDDCISSDQKSNVKQSDKEAGNDKSPCVYPPETVDPLRQIAKTMIFAEYETECCQTLLTTRLSLIESELAALGFENTSIDDVQRMSWDVLEGDIISKWCTAFKKPFSAPERDFCVAIFSASSKPELGRELFTDIACTILAQLHTFAEAMALTKRSSEKLFKLLDMYDTMRDYFPKLTEEEKKSERLSDVTAELADVRSRIGEAAVRIFLGLQNSIKSEVVKSTVPGGSVHPITRYIMNYMKLACEYKTTLTELFNEITGPVQPPPSTDDAEPSSGEPQPLQSPFAAELTTLMNLLDENLDAKSKLYKDLSLTYIFLMNNGRYIIQKVRDSPEIKELLGDAWRRKRSSDLRHYHKAYQRETWSKVLNCLRDEGLMNHNRTSVQKPVLKEKFKSFNAMFDEIHKTQSTWIVQDEQLQSELRVSISAVIVPAYRSFLGRFSQYLDAGRQTEKYIKFGPEELENYIDELFDGNSSGSVSIVKRRG